jgi:6-phosphogluconolactonase
MPSRLLVYLGNYTRGDAAIYHGEVDTTSGALRILGKTPCEDCPSYLALHPSGRYLYAVNEVNTFDGGGAVSAFSIDPASGGLTFLNLQPTVGSPCHNTVDASGRYVLSANYGGGSICMHPILGDGSLGAMTDFKRHEGSSANPQRQESPHPHSFNIDPANRFAFCADLGLDKILVYELDLEGGKLQEHGSTDVTPGAGPRHFAFHPNRSFGYVINEMGNTVTTFAYDEAAGALSQIQEISTIPDDYGEQTYTADIHVTLDGRFLYGSNRGHDSIALFAIGQDGRLTPLGHQAVPATPRNFALDPSGRFLYSGGQNTDTIPVFRIDQASGRLQATGDETAAPTPVCLKFLTVS